MLVRLEPGASYPPHTHAGVEELHLLDGELWINERKLMPGDYNYGPPGASDELVWSETGCTCVLVTSTRDILRWGCGTARPYDLVRPDDPLSPVERSRSPQRPWPPARVHLEEKHGHP
jgi:hypothetical protein